MKHVELEQFLHAFASCGFDSVSWAFLFYLVTQCGEVSRWKKWRTNCSYKYDLYTRSQAVTRIADRTAKNCRGHVT